MIVVGLLFSTALYECFFLTSVAEEFIFSQILGITVFLVGLALYLLIIPLLDSVLSWLPFYNVAKLLLAFAVTHKTDISNSGIDLQQLFIEQQQQQHDNFDLSDDEDGEYDDELGDEMLLFSKKKASQVPPLPPTIKVFIDLINTCNLFFKAYARRMYRSALWRLRTWAHDTHAMYSVALDNDELDRFSLEFQKQQQQQQIPQLANNDSYGSTSSGEGGDFNTMSRPDGGDVIESDEELLSTYVTDDFGHVPQDEVAAQE